MIFCKALNKEYSSKKKMLKALKENKEAIIKAKKSAYKNSDAVNFFIKKSKATKAEPEQTSGLKYGDKIYPVINTTNYMDSHDDVHIKGIWDKDLSEAQGKIKLVIDHQLSIDKLIAWEDNVNVIVKELTWSQLGKSFEGTTEALIFETTLTEESDDKAFLAYKNKRPVQHSVRMMYNEVILCVMRGSMEDDNEGDDDHEDAWMMDFEDEYKNWEKHIVDVVNKDQAVKQGYFWAVTSAKIIDEGSLVLRGSNDQTPTLYSIPSKDDDPEEIEQPENMNEEDDEMKNLINQFRNIINK